MTRMLTNNDADSATIVPFTGCTALHFAAPSSQILRILLSSSDANINASNQNGVTPLLETLLLPVTITEHFITRSIQVLLDHQADINAVLRNGTSALTLAVRQENLERVELLLRYKANANQQETETGLTALHLCTESDRVEICRALLGRGARTDIADYNGETPLDLARRLRKIAILKMMIQSRKN